MPGMTLILLSQGLWGIFAAHFEKVRVKRLRFASFDYGIDIGFANGIGTSIVRYDIDYTAIHAHAYPVAPEEAKKHPLVTLDDLNLEVKQLSDLIQPSR